MTKAEFEKATASDIRSRIAYVEKMIKWYCPSASMKRAFRADLKILKRQLALKLAA